MKNFAFETYEGKNFSVQFISNGYLLTYWCPAHLVMRQASFLNWNDVVEFLQKVYSGEWR